MIGRSSIRMTQQFNSQGHFGYFLYLKYFSIFRHNLDTSSLPGPVGVPPSSCHLSSYCSGNLGIMTPQSSHISSSPLQQPMSPYPPNQQQQQQQQVPPLNPSLQPLILPPQN
ncbi:hypothetical protein P879_06961 [Paragonimus westermani]|uniref:Uncharacterized protein n=1 Tax=Paragonimus westermani TaxID=34504 RepID=A0A8T0DRT5_9TREM|nr:hypothetical protein P879_06961 [Paragonimus westermani]